MNGSTGDGNRLFGALSAALRDALRDLRERRPSAGRDVVLIGADGARAWPASLARDAAEDILRAAGGTVIEIAGDGHDRTGACAHASLASRLRDGRAMGVVIEASQVDANGDVYAAVGAYGAALAAAAHRIPLLALTLRASISTRRTSAQAAPTEANAREVYGAQLAHDGRELVPAYLITTVVTEYGSSRPPFTESLGELAVRPAIAALRAGS